MFLHFCLLFFKKKTRGVGTDTQQVAIEARVPGEHSEQESRFSSFVFCVFSTNIRGSGFQQG